jgi:hypothetical protein
MYEWARARARACQATTQAPRTGAGACLRSNVKDQQRTVDFSDNRRDLNEHYLRMYDTREEEEKEVTFIQ